MLALTVLRQLCASGEARRIRLALGLSLTEIADAVSADTSTIHRWERGQRAPRRSARALAYADLLGRLLALEGRR